MIIDCKSIADAIIESVHREASGAAKTPRIASVVIGSDGGSESYLKMMEKTFERAGFGTCICRLAEDATTEQAIALVESLNADREIDGVIIHKPLPPQIDERRLLYSLDPRKDLDGLHPVNLGKTLSGDAGAIAPCTARAAVEVAKGAGIELTGKHVVIIGRSSIVGKPAALLFLSENATVTVCHSKTSNLADITKRADIIVVAVGRPRFLGREMVSEHSVVIDVGTNNVDGKMVGDADFDAIFGLVKMITPVPGGVGRVTNAVLLANALTNFTNNNK